MIDFGKIVGYSDSRYPALDSTTAHYEFLSYLECCESLGVKPSLRRFMAYQNYIKSLGIFNV
jgi:hypothetical protein